ncbi:alpha/beta hydrolase [Streptomyces sp. NPDC052396]|uniref:alpha/beta hydrolase n=1 Tax=Streptomyces sp. NPDC052396 TaxID=3365689 RepID=UPI0037D2058B
MPNPNPPSGYQSRGRRRASRAKRWLIGVMSLAALGLITWQVMSYYEIPPFTDKGDPVSYDQADNPKPGQAAHSGDSKVLLPTGPKAAFKNVNTMDDGTHISVVTLDGKKSGYKGKVWVWAPKEYTDDPKFAASGFPVMIALPGGPGYDSNYWMGKPGGFSLQEAVSKWYQQGIGKPFLLAMPVLNPGPDDKGIYWDASDIPGQPKMGTWLTEDVPDLMKANFRTLKSREGWAYMGSSTGGFASLKSVLKYPDRFKAAIANGPDIVPDSPLWRGHPQEMRENNPEVLAKELAAAKGPDVYLAFQVGTRENKATMTDVKKFIKTYGHGPVHTKLWEIPGGTHNGATYGANMSGPMKWISDQLEGPTPSS